MSPAPTTSDLPPGVLPGDAGRSGRVNVGKAVTIILLLATTAACGTSTTTSPPLPSSTTVPTAVTPSGWKTYTYAGATISVPATWTVLSDRGCVVHSASGVLALGTPRSLANCPVGVDTVVVSPLPRGDTQALTVCPAVRVNGLAVHILPCTQDRSRSIVEYLVPALGVQAVGTGAPGQDVAGAGTGSVVGRVLRTLH